MSKNRQVSRSQLWSDRRSIADRGSLGENIQRCRLINTTRLCNKSCSSLFRKDGNVPPFAATDRCPHPSPRPVLLLCRRRRALMLGRGSAHCGAPLSSFNTHTQSQRCTHTHILTHTDSFNHHTPHHCGREQRMMGNCVLFYRFSFNGIHTSIEKSAVDS